MSTTTTTNISLIKDSGDEQIINFRSHMNSNWDTIDSEIYDILGEIPDSQEFKLLIEDYILTVGRYGKSGMYRELNLGSGTSFLDASTSEQRAAIADGTFDGLYIGAYWTINDTLYRIADFNYWKNSGDSGDGLTDNHVIIVPDKNWGNGRMNSSDSTTGGYTNTEMYTSSSSVLNQVRSTISTDFGSYLVNHREYLPNATSSGAQSGAAWVDSTVELMNELMVYGCFIHTKPRSDLQYLPTIDKSQLALFRLNPAMVNLRYSYWLRDVVTSATFAGVSHYGGAAYYNASESGHGVRVAFGIRGTA